MSICLPHLSAFLPGQTRLEMASTRDVFVATESYRLGLQRLASGRGSDGDGDRDDGGEEGVVVLLITGPPDSGKSCLAHALLRHYAERCHYTPLIVKSYEEWRQHVGADSGKQAVLADHALGREQLDRCCFHKWAESFQTLRAFAAGGGDACLAVVVTVNDHVLAEVGVGSSGGELFDAVVDLSAAQPPYTDDEKAAMLLKHLDRKGKSIPRRRLDDILRKDASGLFFPALCKQYANALGRDGDANADSLFTAKQLSSRHGRRPRTTPLHTACYNGDSEAVNAFLEAGANTELVDADGNTPLHIASRRGHAEIVENLSAKSASATLNMENFGDQTPLSLACKSGNSSVVRILLKRGASVNEATKGKTPLHIACERGCLEIVKTLLEHKADVDRADMLGQTTLHCVLEDRGKFQDPNMYDIVKLLLLYNANVNLADDYGTTPLDLVFTYSQNECIQKTVLLHMAKNDIKTSNGATAVHVACMFCSQCVVYYLLQKYPSLGVDVRDNNGTTPLLTAVQSRSPFRTNVIQYLLESGADINAMDHTGLCPFEEYVRRDYELLDLFVKHGADVHRHDGFGNTLLHQACRTEMHKRGVYVLIAYGLSIHAKNQDGDTPLHIACAVGNCEGARVLLGLGSSTDAQNKAGKSPMDIAFENNYPGLLSLMMYSQLNVSDRKGSASESRNSGDVSDETKTDECVAAENISLQSGLADQMSLQKSQARLMGTDADQSSYCRQCAESGKTGILPDRKEGQNFLTNPVAFSQTSTDNLYSASRDFDQKCSNRASDFLVSLSNDCQDDKTCKCKTSEYEEIAVNIEDMDPGLCDMARPAEGDNEDLRFKSRFRQTRLHSACDTCDLPAAETLLEEEGNAVNRQDQNGRTPLHCAATRGHIVIVDLLLQNGSKVNVTDNHGQSPLHLACSSGHSSVAAMLLSHGAEVNSVDGSGDTALFMAARKGFSCTVAVLVGRGAALNYRDRNYGNTALHLAAVYGQTEVGLLLLHSGSRTTVRNRKGDTAMALAASAQRTAFVRILERRTYSAGRVDKRPPSCVCWRELFLLWPALVFILTWMCGLL